MRDGRPLENIKRRKVRVRVVVRGRMSEWFHPVTGCTQISCMSTDIASFYLKNASQALRRAWRVVCLRACLFGTVLNGRRLERIAQGPRRVISGESFLRPGVIVPTGAPSRLRHRPGRVLLPR